MNLRSVVQVLSFDLVSKVILGLIGVLLIRYMPETEYARYTLGVSAAALATGTLGQAFNRIYIVGHERLRVTDAFHFLGFQLLALGVLAVAMLPLRSHVEGLYGVLLALAAASCLSEFCKTLVQQEMRFGQFSAIEVGRSFLQSAGVLALLFLAPGRPRAWQVLLAQAAALALVSAAALRGRRILPGIVQAGSAVRLARRVFAGGYTPLFGYFAMVTVLSQVDVFMLKGFASPLQLATYGSAFRYYSLLSLALGAVHAVLLPTMQAARSPDEEDAVLARQLRMVVLFAVPVVLSAWAARWVIPWVDAGRYPGAVAVFRVLAASAVFSFALSPHVNLLLKVEDFRFLFGLITAAVCAQVALDLVLVPRWGALGAASATLVTYLATNGSIFLRARHLRRERRRLHPAPGPPLAGAVPAPRA